MSVNPTKRVREVERIEDWDAARYSHVPPRAATDERLTLAHLRVLVLIGKVNTKQGWCQLSQTAAADLFGMHRNTVNAAISDLVEWLYVERRTQKQTKTAFCHYRVLIDEPETDEGVPPTDGTPSEMDVPHTDGTGATPESCTGAADGRHAPINRDRAREIKDQRSLPPKSPDGGLEAKSLNGKAAWLAALLESGKHRDAVDGLIAPLLASDKRLSLGKAPVEALVEIATAAHGIGRPALDAAVKRLAAQSSKLTVANIRDEIARARNFGAQFVIMPGMAQWTRWLEYFETADPRQAAVVRKQTSWQVPSEWPPASGNTQGAAG
ncbi:hypothetical protein [Hyphomicrobium sp. LHD-15]|uniref:hypothetical protein n=1 Tax=Hyphomicrobium sp. LHD-15 TaxID=3072142 RepID=UPI00280FEB32|nr:hypothetical protein [Hyphomicrobium sp. LHD-15]MDQ8700586.1 hypothetical protein [Hyphomicrobium sp. LHD-15]